MTRGISAPPPAVATAARSEGATPLRRSVSSNAARTPSKGLRTKASSSARVSRNIVSGPWTRQPGGGPERQLLLGNSRAVPELGERRDGRGGRRVDVETGEKMGQHGTVDQVAGEVVVADGITDGTEVGRRVGEGDRGTGGPEVEEGDDAAGRQPRMLAQRGERGDGVGRHHRVGK